MINSRSLKLPIVVFAAAIACLLSLIAAAPAWADSYTAALQTGSNTSSLAVGDEFTVSEVLTDNDASEFTMYALSSQVVFDTTKLELVSVAAGQYGVATIQSNTVVYNALSGPFAGTIIDSPFTMCTATFKVIAEGDPNISFKRVSVSTYSGMHSFPVSTTGLTVVGQTIEPTAPEQTEPGTATEAEATEDSKDQVKKNTSTIDDLLDNGTLTKAVIENAHKAGITDSDLKTLGVTQDELDRANNGETVVPAAASEESKELAATVAGVSATDTGSASNSSASTNTNANANKAATNQNINNSNNASQGNGIPVVPIVVIVIIVIAAAIIGGVAYSKSKKKASGENSAEPKDKAEDTDTKE